MMSFSVKVKCCGRGSGRLRDSSMSSSRLSVESDLRSVAVVMEPNEMLPAAPWAAGGKAGTACTLSADEEVSSGLRAGELVRLEFSLMACEL